MHPGGSYQGLLALLECEGSQHAPLGVMWEQLEHSLGEAQLLHKSALCWLPHSSTRKAGTIWLLRPVLTTIAQGRNED